MHPELQAAILAAVPKLRAFAVSLTGNPDAADDMVQDSLTKAWQRPHLFSPGTNLNAWLFTILRNTVYSHYRKRRREVPDPDGQLAAQLAVRPEQSAKLDFQDMQAALAHLPIKQREALILITAEGMSYEEVAQLTGVAVGTVKSRVNRARARLAELLGIEHIQDIGPDRLGA